MHLISVNLNLMRSDNGKEIILLQNLFHRLETKLVRAFPLDILRKLMVTRFFISTWVGP